MNRKDEHVSLAKAFHKEQANDFDSIRLIHSSLPELALDEVDLSTDLFQYTLTSPFYINAMTGGSEKTKEINRQLAIIAKETDLLITTGSVSAALKDPQLVDSYRVMREEFPNGKILVNIGGGVSVENAQRAVDLFETDGLQIHLNAPQELVMPEGDRNFHDWLIEIEKINHQLNVPILVKEVGFGMTRETIRALLSVGIQTIDVSGQGGTSFTQIENARRKKREFAYLSDWGQSTVISLLEANELSRNFQKVASGGIRDAYDIFKALCLGADAVGVSGTILNSLLTDGTDKTIDLIRRWQEELRVLYTMTGHRSTAELKNHPLILTGYPKDWCEARNIDITQYGLRNL
ncbi:type 2 isopentenyl-diphosphate Delta-isomerase [Enterococcus sp. JM4C]|uniref:type 2 isopentenyl-diphosphate Delta-isomerase n=1 Tax=Candidatus Enterococcus huntleyi TaxID=1857217 RepID=UPI00137B16C2|nr:type 2 isopentenyl-diphosphate Delta-isomerase [Enterococcus sp. JM4C]KAF1299547.1 type 2 isopentenyl-diphosphate Delta-isomerase [Enterococcus sp. JM4C]